MDSLILLYLVGGALLGGLAASLFLKQRLRLAEERLEASEESSRQALSASSLEIEKLKEEAAHQQEMLAIWGNQMADSLKKHGELARALETGQVEYRALSRQLRDAEARITLLTAENHKISQLSATVEQKDEEIRRLRQELDSAKAAQHELEEALAEERRSIEDCLIFVEGSHYLPGRVVRNLIAEQQASS